MKREWERNSKREKGKVAESVKDVSMAVPMRAFNTWQDHSHLLNFSAVCLSDLRKLFEFGSVCDPNCYGVPQFGRGTGPPLKFTLFFLWSGWRVSVVVWVLICLYTILIRLKLTIVDSGVALSPHPKSPIKNSNYSKFVPTQDKAKSQSEDYHKNIAKKI